MALSIKQVGFCQDYAKSGDKLQAYRDNYNTINMLEKSVGSSSSEMLRNPKIITYLAKLRGAVEEKVISTLVKADLYDRKQAASDVDRAIAIAEDKKNAGAMIAGVQLKAKLYGLIIDKAEIKSTVIDDLSDKDALAVMEALKAIASSKQERFIATKTVQDVTDE